MADAVQREHAASKRTRSGLVLSTRACWLIVVAIALVSFVTIMLSVTRLSPTFDEITTMTVPAREMKTGRWDIMENYPPLTQYLYGLPVYLSSPNYPEHQPGVTPNRYQYARQMLFQSGNDPRKIAFLAKAMAAACAFTLILLTFAFTSRHYGEDAGIIAALLVAFLPDVLAQGGVAYNDIVLALTFLASIWALDSAVRTPSVKAGIIAGVFVSLAVATKHSGLVLGPIAIVLLLIEAIGRGDRRAWIRPILGTVVIAALVGYLVQVLLYRGDFTLRIFRESLPAAQSHIAGGHGVPAYLLGQKFSHAPWYFYPVAFLYKTPAAFHILMLLAAVGAVRYLNTRPASDTGNVTQIAAERWRSVLCARWRSQVVAIAVFGYFLISANLVIGFRYALPVLPFVCVLVAAGLMLLWRTTPGVPRLAVALLVGWSVVGTVSFFPNFLAYTSEYQSDRDFGFHAFVDSSLDWGQSLPALADFMRSENVETIYLSYFGSALPEAYGVDYIPMPSFFPLQHRAVPPKTPPRFAAISATNLMGLYFLGDPYAQFRKVIPYRVIGHNMFVYRMGE